MASILYVIFTPIPLLNDEYVVNEGIDIHPSATIEAFEVIKSPAIIGKIAL